MLAADFAHQMLVRGAAKFGSPRSDRRGSGCASSSSPSGSLDLLITAFGFRNLANYRAGLEEFYRTLKPNGELGILDFNEPGGLMGKLYAFFSAGSCRRGVADLGSLGTVPLPSPLRSPVPCPPGIAANLGNLWALKEVSWTPYSLVSRVYSAGSSVTM